jgi:ABC-type amino acid transport substrate-binding protein
MSQSNVPEPAPNTVEIKAPEKEKADELVEIGDIPVIRGKRWYVSLSMLFAAVSSLVAGTYFCVHYIETNPIKDKLADIQQSLTASESDRLSVRSDLSSLQLKYDTVLKINDRPILSFPLDQSSLIGTDITFLWDYSKADSAAGYILNVQSLSANPVTSEELNVVRPETRRAFYSLPNVPSGEYLWRICPGSLVGPQRVVQGQCSNPSTFFAYSSVLERIRATNSILVATTPTSYDNFISTNGNGKYSGFELDIAQYVVDKISEKLALPTPLKLNRPLEIPWSRLFQAMQYGEADIAIRSITRTSSREREYSNLKFSKGYLINHQIFIQRSKGKEFPSELKAASVGVKKNSMNERAAKLLAPKYKFTVDASYIAYGDIFQALRDGKLDFALVDSALAGSFLSTSGYQYGPNMDSDLRVFYNRELGGDHEEYSILVYDGGSSQKLLPLINSIIDSPGFATFKASLQAKYNVSE